MSPFTKLCLLALTLSALVTVFTIMAPEPTVSASSPEATPTPSAFTCRNVIELDPTDCQALVTIYNGIHSKVWRYYSDWLKSNQPCSWYNVTCTDRRVTTLDLSGYGITNTLPSALGQLTALQVLDLADNRMTALPVELGQLTNLQRLFLGDNQLTTIPNEVGNLLNLVALHLSGNRLTALPPSVGNLANLTDLQLASNQLTQLPAELGNLARLTTLNVGRNRLASVPPELGRLANLQTLSLEGNQLTSLPGTYGQLRNLVTLNVSSNRLLSLPPELGNLVNLVRLNGEGNQLQDAPAWLGNLTALTGLSLAKNQLTALPATLTQLPNLQRLYLEDNRLQSLPDRLGDLSHLLTLTLHNNPQLTGVLSSQYVNLPLQTFTFQQTQLCESTSNVFQGWAKTIPVLTRSGLFCETLALDHPVVAPGSVLTLTGRGFQPASTFSLLINQTAVITLTTDSSGGFTLHLTTDQADPGAYFLTTALDLAVIATFRVSPSAALYQQPGAGLAVNVPAGMGYKDIFYLPIIARKPMIVFNR